MPMRRTITGRRWRLEPDPGQPLRLLVSGNQWRRHDSEMEPQGEKNSPFRVTKTKRGSRGRLLVVRNSTF